MSFQVGTACYSTPEQAAQASASSQIGGLVSQSGTLYAVNASSVTASSITYTFQPIAGGASFQSVTPYTAQPCALLGIEDGITIGWAVAFVWIGVFAIKFIAHALKGEPDNGNP